MITAPADAEEKEKEPGVTEDTGGPSEEGKTTEALEEAADEEEVPWDFPSLTNTLLDMAKFPLLVTLSLRGTKVGDAYALARALEENLTLKHLNLADCNLSTAEIGRALRYHPSLVQLSLNRNSIGDEGALEMVSLLTGNASIDTIPGYLGNQISICNQNSHYARTREQDSLPTRTVTQLPKRG